MNDSIITAFLQSARLQQTDGVMSAACEVKNKLRQLCVMIQPIKEEERL